MGVSTLPIEDNLEDQIRSSRTFTQRILTTLAQQATENWIEFWNGPTEQTRWSYAELSEDARRIAVWITKKGYRPGTTVVLAFSPGINFIRAVLGALHAGLVIAPIPLVVADDEHSARRLQLILEESPGGFILCDKPGWETCLTANVDNVALCLPEQNTLSEISTDTWRIPHTEPDDLVILQYTSGSTGNPKGVEITQRNLLENQISIVEITKADTSDVITGWLPHYHDMGLIGMFLHPLTVGCSLVFTSPAQFLRRPYLWLKMISERRATMTVGPDFAYAFVPRLTRPAQVKGLDLTSLRAVITGSEPVRWASMCAFDELTSPLGFKFASFRPAYGMAETTLLITGGEPERYPRILKADRDQLSEGQVRPAEAGHDATTLVSCGVPASQADVRIVSSDTGEEVAEGTVGEILVRGPWVSRGYRGRERTTQDFAARIDGIDADYLRTGDLGTFIDGRLFVTGRAKEVIILRGRNIFPQDVEQSALDAIGSGASGTAAAFELDDGIGIVIELTPEKLRENTEPLRQELAQVLRDRFGVGNVTIKFGRRGSLPKTSSGKVQRGKVRESMAAGDRGEK